MYNFSQSRIDPTQAALAVAVTAASNEESVIRNLILLVLVGCLPGSVFGQDVQFVRDIQPVLKRHCYSCHGETKQKSGLRLDIKSEAFKGGDSYGESIVAGSSADSPLIELVCSDDESERMPPDGDRLPESDIAMLSKWIDQGAIWPDGVDLAKLENRLDHWSFKAVQPPAEPVVQNKTWSRNAIDRFVLRKLEMEKLTPAPEASPSAWLRRVTLDLTGLPPSPEALAAFLSDTKQAGQTDLAYEKVVERLLQSPRYGEQWAQHWLDVVRYADTHGFEVNTERPNAWPYRDYVIEAFNQDKPYDQFVREQIIGDQLNEGAATGFLVTASVLLPGQIGKDEPSKRLARQDSLDEIVVNIGQTFLGLSVACARCHDHKFDPISQRDYYSMQAFVAGVEYADRELDTPAARERRVKLKRFKQDLADTQQELTRFVPLANSGKQRPAVNARINTDRFAPIKTTGLRFTILATNRLEPCIDELEVFDTQGDNVALATRGTTVTSSGDTTVANRHELRFINDQRYGNSKSWMSSAVGKGSVTFEFPQETEIERVVWGRDRESRFADRLATEYLIEVATGNGWEPVADSKDRKGFVSGDHAASFSLEGLGPEDAKSAAALDDRRKELELKIEELGRTINVFAGKFRSPDKIHLLNRGDPEQPRDRVAPAVLSSLGSLTLARDTPETERRMALAHWIASSKNTLTARVMANRIWQGHFGVGLVETASDFGRMGTKPSHPHLLDWLAQEFINSGWSVKHMHRLLVLSATYRQSTQHQLDGARKDADVRLLWRYPTRRMTAESIRDSILAASGKLNFKTGGPGYNLFKQRGGLSGFTPIESFRGDGLRRMIYAHKVRRERDAVFGAFDCPDAGQSTARRIESTTPIQALNLFNSKFVIEQASAFAKRIQASAGEDIKEQVRQVYLLALSRAPSVEELAEFEPVVQDHGLDVLCRAIFNSNEFLFFP